MAIDSRLLASWPKGFDYVTYFGSSELRYLATLINPVDHRLYDVVAGYDTLLLVSPKNSEDYTNSKKTIITFGTGVLECDNEIEISGRLYCRSNVSEVSSVGKGQGFLLFCALALLSKSLGKEGIYSYDFMRSTEATTWWKKQVDRRFAMETKKEIRGKQRTVQYLPAEEVAQSGCVLGWAEDDYELNSLMKKFGKPISEEVLMDIEFDTTESSSVVDNIVGFLEGKASTSEIRDFLAGIPLRLQEGSDLYKSYFDEYEYTANKEGERHSEEWLSFFGEDLDSI